MRWNRSACPPLLGALLCGAIGGCAPGPGAGRLRQQVGDGDLVVSTAGTVVNCYAALSSDAEAGAAEVRLAPPGVDTLTDSACTFAAGDLVLLHQPQGAAVALGDDVGYGAVTALAGAGQFEFAVVRDFDSITGRLAIGAGCGGLRNRYATAGRAQAVRVPQYDNVEVAAPGAIVARPWDGRVGGILALSARQVRLLGTLDASAAGFRGGRPARSSSSTGLDIAGYRGGGEVGAEKGEGVAVPETLLGAGGAGRGAPANGGGGGNSHKSGGGGGANVGDLSRWTGQGVMDGLAVGALAWRLDPAYRAGGNVLSSASGGGRGGYSFATVANDPLVTPPGDPAWSGNARRERGGLGGRPLPADPQARLFFGGGGGAGDGNNMGPLGGAGGGGGGLVYVITPQLVGTGRIVAGGGAGGVPGGPDRTAGAGGGGGGGSIVISAARLDGVGADASGGVGGVQPTSAYLQGDPEQDGPGGGGGGGLVVVPDAAVVPMWVGGGRGGVSEGSGAGRFPSDGATGGGLGMSALLPHLNLPGCVPAGLRVRVTDGVSQVLPGAPLHYRVTVSNDGPFAVDGAAVVSVMTPQSAARWTCTASGAPETTRCAATAGTGALQTQVRLAPAGQIVFDVDTQAPLGPPQPLRYQVSVAAPAGVHDALPGDNTDTDVDQVVGVADLSAAVRAQSAVSGRGQPLRLDFAVSNLGPEAATAVHQDIELPADVQVEAISAATGWTCAPRDATVRCQREAMAAGEQTAVSITLVPGEGVGQVTVTSRTSSAVADPDLRNNVATTTVAIDPGRPLLGGGGVGCAAGGQATGGGAGGLAVGLLWLGLLHGRGRRGSRCAGRPGPRCAGRRGSGGGR